MNEYTPIFLGEPNQNPPSGSVFSFHDADGYQHLRRSDGSILNNAYTEATQGYIPYFSDVNGRVMSDSPMSVLGSEVSLNGDLVMLTQSGTKFIRTDNVGSTERMAICFIDGGVGTLDIIKIGDPNLSKGGALGLDETSAALVKFNSSTQLYGISIAGGEIRLGATNTTADAIIGSAVDLYFERGLSGQKGLLTSAVLTASRTWTFQNASGTIAFLSDITGAGFATKLDELSDVTLDFDPFAAVQDDDGKMLYYDTPTGQFITSESVTHGTVIINAKTSIGTGSIAKGLPVYVSGFDADLHVVELADANGTGTHPVIGFTSESLNSSDSKHIITFGKLTGLNTTNAVTTLNPNGETWSVGTELYLSTIAGGLTSVRPTGATTVIQKVAKVLRVDATGGQLLVFNTAKAEGLPNLSQNTLWMGDASGNPIETSRTSLGIYAGSGTIPSNTTATVTDWVNFANGAVWIGGNVGAAAGKLVVTGAGSTIATYSIRVKNSVNTQTFYVNDLGQAFVQDNLSVGGTGSGRLQSIALGATAPTIGTYTFINSGNLGDQNVAYFAVCSKSDSTLNIGYQASINVANTGSTGTNGKNLGVDVNVASAVGNNIGFRVGVGGSFSPSVGSDIGQLMWINNNSTPQTTSYGIWLLQNQTFTPLKYGMNISSSGARASGSTFGAYVSVQDQITTGAVYGLNIDVTSATASSGVFGIAVNSGTNVFNANQGDWDFIIRGDNVANLFYVDASTDRIGVGIATPDARFQVRGAGNTSATISLLCETSGGADTFAVADSGQVVVGGTAGVIVLDTSIDLRDSGKALLLNRVSDAQEVLITGVNGMFMYNTNQQALRVYRNGAWRSVTNKYEQNYTGVAGADTVAVIHNLNTLAVTVSVLNLTTNQHVGVNVTVNSVNQITISANLDTGVNHTITVIG